MTNQLDMTSCQKICKRLHLCAGTFFRAHLGDLRVQILGQRLAAVSSTCCGQCVMYQSPVAVLFYAGGRAETQPFCLVTISWYRNSWDGIPIAIGLTVVWFLGQKGTPIIGHLRKNRILWQHLWKLASIMHHSSIWAAFWSLWDLRSTRCALTIPRLSIS